MTRVRAWRMIIKVSQVGRFVSTLSHSPFLPFFLATNHIRRVVRACRFGDDLFAAIKDTEPPHDWIDHSTHRVLSFSFPAPSTAAYFFFLLISYCHDNTASTSNCIHEPRGITRRKKARLIAAMSNRSAVYSILFMGIISISR